MKIIKTIWFQCIWIKYLRFFEIIILLCVYSLNINPCWTWEDLIWYFLDLKSYRIRCRKYFVYFSQVQLELVLCVESQNRIINRNIFDFLLSFPTNLSNNGYWEIVILNIFYLNLLLFVAFSWLFLINRISSFLISLRSYI